MRLSLVLVSMLLAGPAVACGDGSCEPPPKPETPRHERTERNDPVPQVSLPLPCCIRDGVVVFKSPWPSASKRAETKLTCKLAVRERASFRPCTAKETP